MTERFPMSVTSTDPFERALLGSVRRDHPGPQALRRTAAALGLGATTFVSAGTAAGAIGGVAAASGAATASLPWLALKAVAIGALCGSVTLVGVKVASPSMQSMAPQHSSASVVAGSEARPSGARLAPQPEEPVGVPIASREQQAVPALPPGVSEPGAVRNFPQRRANAACPTAEPAPVDTSPTPEGVTVNTEPPAVRSLPAPTDAATASATPPHAAVTATIGDEIACIDRARQAMREGKARVALSELARYQSRWPGGVFAMESAILRVEAKLALGDRAAAERDANAILSRHPNSRYAARLRTLFEQAKKSDQNPGSVTAKGL